MPIRTNTIVTPLTGGFFNIDGNTLEIGPFSNPFGNTNFVLTLIAATALSTITSVSLIDNISTNLIYSDVNKKNMFFIEQFVVNTDYVISNSILDAKNFSMMISIPNNFNINILYTGAPTVPASTSMLIVTGS
ncbi:hypothetical protein LCGC14_2176760 [marine sediment metagenome]|uniref:Uncharacterized protein n=1 Tax=marine sediment metagenome TaxID=412755 RepID=A0A0F9EAS3_9ZZZZ